MAESALTEKLTADAYLKWEAAEQLRHEFVDGEVFAMVGGTRQHETIVLNLAVSLRTRLANSPCRAYASGMKLRVETSNSFFYPDIFVTCSARDHQATEFLSEPTLIIEVLSPSTEAYDRGDKFAKYRLLPSLQEYVLIAPDSRQMEVFRKDHTGHWVLYDFSGQANLTLASLSIEIAAAEIFVDV